MSKTNIETLIDNIINARVNLLNNGGIPKYIYLQIEDYANLYNHFKNDNRIFGRPLIIDKLFDMEIRILNYLVEPRFFITSKKIEEFISTVDKIGWSD